MLKRVVFLDRDGVINRDSADYIKECSEFHFLPGSLEALRLLRQNGFTTIVITNQSAVHRNLISRATLNEIHEKMKREVTVSGGAITDIFFCPHRPDEGCDCRKPKPGLILQAQEKYRVDLSGAWMIGDSVKDIECGRNACCGHTVLVRTGNGSQAEKSLLERNTPPDFIADTLLDAVRWVVSRSHMIGRPQSYHRP